MKKELWRKSVLKRLIISFILILMPIYILSIIIYDLGISTLRNEISNSMVSQLSFYKDSLENDINRVGNLEIELVNDKDLNRLAAIPESMDGIEQMERILRVQQRLYAIKSSSKYIGDMYVMIPALQRTVSSTSVSEFDSDLFEKMKYIDSHPEAELDKNVIKYMTVSYPYAYMTNKREKLFIIVIEISKSRVIEALQSMVQNPAAGVMFVKNSNKSIIAADNNDLNQQVFNKITRKNNAEEIVVNNNRYLAVSLNSTVFDSTLCKYLPEDSVFYALKKYSSWFLLLTVSAVVIIVLFSIYMYNFIHKPISKLAASFKKVEKGDFEINIEHRHDDEFRYIYHRFNVMIDNLKALVDQVYKQKILVQRAEMKQLQSQIRPHFLYNSFFILNTMARVGDYDNLEIFTEQLGQYFQFITRNAADEVPIEKEINHARVYSEIQAMRFSNQIKVRFDQLPDEFKDLVVPRLILQPVIENAFEHGLTMSNGQGLLVISFENSENQYKIIVEDNGNNLDEQILISMRSSLEENSESAEVTALQNIHQRLKLKFGPSSGLQLEKGALGGLMATITIFIEKEDQNV